MLPAMLIALVLLLAPFATGLTYEFTLRRNARFHNGDPVTAEDVKFSFERYRGVAARTFKSRVASVDVLSPQRVRFVLRQPWPDFMTFYGTPATGAGWIVPKKYVERVGDDGFKKAPVGAGPYRFVSYLGAIGIRLKLAPMERAAHTKAQQEKRLRGLNVTGTASFGNAASRIEAYVASGGVLAWGSYPDIDALFQEQVAEPDRKRREAMLHRIQQLMHERAMFVPLLEPAILHGYGPRVAESGLGLITGYSYSAPYEDVRLKAAGR